MVAPDMPCEGESEGSTLPTGKESDSSKRKRVEMEEVPDIDTPRKTHGIRTNYRYLNDPFPDEEEMNVEDVQLTSAELIFAAFAETPLGGEEPKSLEEAKQSPEWPEWEHAVKTELAQLEAMGTWELA